MTQQDINTIIAMPTEKSWVPRLNALLRFAQVEPWTLTNSAREDLLDDLFFAFYNMRRDRSDPLREFQDAATPEGLAKAQRGLKQRLEEKGADRFLFPLAQQTLVLFKTTEGGFYYRFTSKDFPTMVYMSLAYLLFMSDLKPWDFLRCANCNTWFIPKRKPRKGTPSYCSRRCANVVMAKHYRARKKKRAMKPTGKKKSK